MPPAPDPQAPERWRYRVTRLALVSTLLYLVAIALLAVGASRLEAIYHERGLAVPEPTRLVLSLGKALPDHWAVASAPVAGIWLFWAIAIRGGPAGRRPTTRRPGSAR